MAHELPPVLCNLPSVLLELAPVHPAPHGPTTHPVDAFTAPVPAEGTAHRRTRPVGPDTASDQPEVCGSREHVPIAGPDFPEPSFPGRDQMQGVAGPQGNIRAKFANSILHIFQE